MSFTTKGVMNNLKKKLWVLVTN